jgi:hypothetical protein
MSRELLIQHWALVTAAGPLAAVALYALLQGIGKSSFRQLQRSLLERDKQAKAAAKARAATGKTESRLDDLLKKSDRVKPRQLQEAKDALQDSRALQKIAEDKLLIAENHVRRIIHEEFPPVKQPRLRDRYLPEPNKTRRPFSF